MALLVRVVWQRDTGLSHWPFFGESIDRRPLEGVLARECFKGTLQRNSEAVKGPKLKSVERLCSAPETPRGDDGRRKVGKYGNSSNDGQCH